MSRRRHLLQEAAFVQEREAQEGVNVKTAECTGDFFPLMKCYSIELYLDYTGINSSAVDCAGFLSRAKSLYGYNMLLYGLGNKPVSIRLLNSDVSGLACNVGAREGLNHLVLVCDNNSAKVYTNGIENPPKNIADYEIGLLIKNSSLSKSIRIFDYALSATEVTTLYNSGEPEKYVLPTWNKRITSVFSLDLSTSLLMGSASFQNETIQMTNVHTSHESLFVYGHAAKLPAEISEKNCVGYFEINVEYTANYDVRLLCGFSMNSLSINAPSYTVLFPKNKNKVTFYIPTSPGGELGGLFYGFNRNFSMWLYKSSNISIPAGELSLSISSVQMRSVGCIAEYLPQNITQTAWLDSAKQLPVNNEYLYPLKGSIGGNDLSASGTPEVVNKPLLLRKATYTNFTAEGLISTSGDNAGETIATFTKQPDGYLLHCFGLYKPGEGYGYFYPRFYCSTPIIVGNRAVVALEYELIQGDVSIIYIESFGWPTKGWTNLNKSLAGQTSISFESVGQKSNSGSACRIDFGDIDRNNGEYKILIKSVTIEEYDK